MMVLKPTIIRFSAIRPLSPWERARERANRNNLKKTSSEKDGNTNTHDPNHQKKNINNNCCQIRFRRPLPTKTDTHRLTKTYGRFAIRENDTDILEFRSLPNPLPQGEGMIVLNRPLSDFLQSAPLPRRGNDGAKNRPLSDFLQSIPSPRGRGLGRGQNPITLRKRRLKKMATKNTHYPNHQKKNIKKQLLPNTFQTAFPRSNGHTSSEIRFPRYLKLGDSTWASSQFLLRLRSR